MGFKRKFSRKDQPNLKRFRSEITELLGDDGKSSDRHGSSQAKGKGRKQKRQEMRKLKKARRLAYSQHKPLPTLETKQKKEKAIEKDKKRKETKEKLKEKKKKSKEKNKEVKEQIAEMRKKNMAQEIKQEEKMLKQLEKHLHLNKRKRKSLPQSFLSDGLDYILDAVDVDKLKTDFEEDDLDDIDDEDLGWLKKKKIKSRKQSEIDAAADDTPDEDEDDTDDEEIDEDETDDMADENSDSEDNLPSVKQTLSSAKKNVSDIKPILKTSTSSTEAVKKTQKRETRVKFVDSEPSISESDNDEESIDNDDQSDMGDEDEDDVTRERLSEVRELKEDIYGRLRDSRGNVVQASTGTGTYVPPGKRLAMAEGDGKQRVALERLCKQLKGLVNRVSQANMNPISAQIEEMYRSNSRADMNETLSRIIMDACVSVVITPERLVMELMMLLTILHGNVGMEVGATFTQKLAERFSSLCDQSASYGEGKEVDNVVLLLSYLYNFKVIHSVLIMDLIKKFVAAFQEKDIELLLLLLKNIGFSLRKDDPVTLKQVIHDIQTKASGVDTTQFEDKLRVRFMLDTLLAIKNNNMRKIPNYDPDHFEQLKKQTRVYLRGHGLGVGQLRIQLDDLIQAGVKGRWWVVGSAWTGRDQSNPDTGETTPPVTDPVGETTGSDKILEVARKQRMNTDIRRNIFCTIMASEDYIDAFERLLRLGLKHQQEREIIHVILDCCQQEKSHNPFYAYLMQKFCEYDRRFQMTFQFTMWDRFKEMGNLSQQNRDNLGQTVVHLLATKAVSLSIFKVVEFGALDKIMVRFMKQVLRGLLLEYPDHVTEGCFMRIAPLTKLHLLHEGLKLFMQHFLLKKKSADIKDYAQLKERVSLAERALSSSQSIMLL